MKVVARNAVLREWRGLQFQAVVLTAQQRFAAFVKRMEGKDALAGLESVPISSLPQAVRFIGEAVQAGSPSAEELARGVARAYAKADALLAQGALPREMAALMFRISRKRLLQECRDRCLAWVDRPTVTGGTLRFSFFFTQNLPLHPAAREASVAMSSKEDLASKAHSKRTRR